MNPYKILFLFSLCFFTQQGYAQRAVQIDAKEAAEMLGQMAISRHILPEHRENLELLLLGTRNGRREAGLHAYITSITCTISGEIRTCRFSVNNDDGEYESSYVFIIETEPDSTHMLSVRSEFAAG